ncbi:c6 zinc finger protein [Fusarium flagelliforme]|uniref:C6 zinc finger protein n=1 Tax=Fusarium flagelliforme TaxID=2675880 RepID=A0A395MGL3_9HYPO|nr:c6 zinc finger protein [Fusarium flagelliforme]
MNIQSLRTSSILTFYVNSLRQGLQSANGTYTLQHLSLLHHFTSSTALTLSVNGQVQGLWQVDIPRIGFSFPFVIHAILALSSMHMAHELPDQNQARWASGIELQQQAVTGAQKALNNITTENCTAVFLFSALTCIISLARGCGHSPKCGPDTEQPTEIGCESLIECVVLYRGTRHLLGPPYEQVLHSGPLKPMFELGSERRIRLFDPLITLDTDQSSAWSKLQTAIYDRVKDTERLDAYDSTIDHLRRAFRAVYDKPLEQLENMDVFAWMFAISDKYVALLRQQDPIALALFACFAGLIREMRSDPFTQLVSFRTMTQQQVAQESTGEQFGTPLKYRPRAASALIYSASLVDQLLIRHAGAAPQGVASLHLEVYTFD